MRACKIYPNRISIFNLRSNENAAVRLMNRQIDLFEKQESPQEYENLKKTKKTWELSRQTKNKIKDSIQVLYQLAPARDIKINKKKTIRNFRCSFITLTLPSIQNHADQEIKKCLNRFLMNLRKVYGMQNYVWKAELQKNENIHFHLITDIFAPHQAIRYYWNKALKPLGYIEQYRIKFANMSLAKYAEYRQIPVNAARAGYVYGRRTNWESPSTESVESIHSPKKLAIYLAKYLSKSLSETEKDVSRIKAFGRVWARSQSISRLKLVSRWDWANIRSNIKSFKGWEKFFYVKSYEYVDMLYFKFENLTKPFKAFINQIFQDLAVSYGYPLYSP